MPEWKNDDWLFIAVDYEVDGGTYRMVVSGRNSDLDIFANTPPGTRFLFTLNARIFNDDNILQLNDQPRQHFMDPTIEYYMPNRDAWLKVLNMTLLALNKVIYKDRILSEVVNGALLIGKLRACEGRGEGQPLGGTAPVVSLGVFV